MHNFLLFSLTVLFWSITWVAIHFQVSTVPPLWSVSYRFFIAGLMMLAYCAIKGTLIRFTWKQHLAIALQGIFLFSLNFSFIYSSSAYLASGLISVIFASILLFNIIHTRIYFKTSLSWELIFGSIVGLSGLCLMFSRDFINLWQGNGNQNVCLGILLALIGTYCASLGNMLATQLKKQQLALIPTTGFSMVYGALFTACIALALQHPPSFSWAPAYLFSMLYLILGGSIIGFLCYLTLLGYIGAARAAFIFVFLPIFAMIISTFVEDLTWHWVTYLGLTLAVCGQVIVLTKSLFTSGISGTQQCA